MPANLPTRRFDAKPALVNRRTDFDLPKLWSGWKEAGKPRAIVRALTADEAGALAVRVDELSGGLQPFGQHQQDEAIGAISSMLGGFRSMRQTEDEAVALLDGLRRVLAPFPLWAIKEACLLIQRGEAMVDGRKLDRRWPPNDSEIYGVTKELVAAFESSLASARALLAAAVETK